MVFRGEIPYEIFMIKGILIASIVIQSLATIFAFRYTKRVPGNAWLFIAGGLSLMGLRRILSLLGFSSGTELIEILELIISLFLFLGVLSATRLFKEFEENVAHIKAIWEMDRIMLTALSPKTLINAIKRHILEVFKCGALAIYKVNSTGQGYEVYANHNLDQNFHNQVATGENKFFQEVIRTKKCRVVPHFASEPGLLRVLNKTGFKSCIGAPLVLRGNPFGILLLLSNSKNDYSRREIQYIEALARQLVLAIERIGTIERIKEMNLESVLALIQAIEMRDQYTKGHSVQVADLAVEVARILDFPEHNLELMKFAGLLHDVGKIAIPETILQKPAALTEEEWLIVKRHPLQSVNIIKPIKNLIEIEPWILYHHERWDGTGYPKGIKGKEIPLAARILAICDTYSAIVSDRPYRRGLTDEHAREEIKKFSGRQFDPEIVNIFLSIPEDFLKRLNLKKRDSS